MFEQIIGNKRNKEILEKTIKINKVSHSYVFWGTEGIGKKLIAKEFAKNILCLTKQMNNCGCKSCIEFDSDNNPDFILIESEEGKIKIEKIRELQRKLAEKPIISNNKVYIIDNADTMTTEAQNCLLKTLEEPPEYLTIILICTNEDGLLGTIKSRCTRIHFENLTEKEVKEYLESKNETNISKNVLELAQGSIGKIERVKENPDTYENIEKILLQMENKDLLEVIDLAEVIYKSKEEINLILEYMNVILLRLAKENIKYIKCIAIVEETKKRLKANSNYDMSIDNMLFNIWEEINEKNSRSQI